MTIKKRIKQIIKEFIPSSVISTVKCIKTLRKIHHTNSKDAFLRGKVVLSSSKEDRRDDYVRQMRKVFSKIKIDSYCPYIYPYDAWVYREIPSGFKLICSLTVDFDKVLNTDIRTLKNKLNLCKDEGFARRHIALIDSIEYLNERICKELNTQKGSRSQELMKFFPEMLYRKPQSLDEAIQKLLFFDALFWQANHWHIGLGRLDLILEEYYQHDITKGIISKDQAIEMLVNLIRTLGRDTKTKSKTLLGDTGQYILLGGIQKDGTTFNGALTELFLDIFEEYHHTDPKLILRINEDTSDSVWQKAVKCVMNGNGSPLFMNEKPIIENMIAFGYKSEDVYQLGTSACWEPLIIGKSFDQNNTLPPIIALKPLTNAITKGTNIDNFDDFISLYKKCLSEYIPTLIKDTSYDCSPLFTLFFDSCIEREKDLVESGADYAFHGIQVLSFPNTINALLNIKQYVFERKVISMKECLNIIKQDYNGFDDYKQLFSSGDLKYGSTNEQVVSLSNDLMQFIGDVVALHPMNDQPLKVGFSSPNYIMSCNGVEASLDGRKLNDPFGVHISPISSNIDIAEILDFASRLNYTKNRINGNVVDFTIPNAFLKNPEKLASLLKSACAKGVFEIQLNVLNFSQLLDAKQNPDKYPGLIVRVWGFSAYFNELPEKYQDLLIERARLYESA